jgi:hypothetical protein
MGLYQQPLRALRNGSMPTAKHCSFYGAGKMVTFDSLSRQRLHRVEQALSKDVLVRRQPNPRTSLE